MKTSAAFFCRVLSAVRCLGWFAAFLCLASADSTQLLLAQNATTPGRLDPSFVARVDGSVRAVLVQPDGHLCVGGQFRIPGVGTNLVRFSRDGTPDPTFNPTSGVSWKVSQAALQPGGKVLVGNKGGVDGWYPSIGLSRFLPDGNRDTNFLFRLPTNSINNGIWSGFWTTALTVQPDGRILLAGSYERDHFDYWYWSAVSLQRLLPDASEGEFFTFSWPSPRSIEVLVPLPDQRLLVAGDQLSRLNADGTEDAGFLRTFLSAGTIACCVTQADGKILVGGSFTNIQGHARCRLARILPDGQLDLSFDPPVSTRSHRPEDTAVRTLAVQADGRILAGGDFEKMNGQPYVALARLNSDGSLDTTFPPILGLDEDEDTVTVSTIVLQEGNRALIGGEYLVTSGGFDAGDLFRIFLDEALPRLSILQVQSGTIRLTFLDPDGHEFRVLSSRDVNLPASNWTVQGFPTNIGGHLYQFTDEIGPSEPHRFYQLQRTPPR